jgi:hypothetical protein
LHGRRCLFDVILYGCTRMIRTWSKNLVSEAADRQKFQKLSLFAKRANVLVTAEFSTPKTINTIATITS